MSKYQRYQDYVIKDGKLVGEFEQMYQDFENPWEQTLREKYAAEKMVAINTINALEAKKVLEFGCGLGHFSDAIREQTGASVLGVDISKTAIEKARVAYPGCEFAEGDILNKELIQQFNPEVIVFAEITWYVLDKLEEFTKMLKQDFPHTYFIHLLNTYPEGEQKYGKDYFRNMDEILRYFGMNYLEYGEIHKPLHGNCKRTYFTGRYQALNENYLL